MYPGVNFIIYFYHVQNTDYRMVWDGKPFKIISFQTPCHRQGHFPAEQVAPSPTYLGIFFTEE